MLTPDIESLLLVGTYSVPGPYFEANGSGLYSLALDRKAGTLRELAVAQEISNASYLAKPPGEPRLFVAADRYLSAGHILGCTVDPTTGHVAKQSAQTVHGTATCHISLNGQGDRAFVSSYLDAKVSVHKLDGVEISPSKVVLEHTGNSEGAGANPDRQEAAHAHQAIVAPGDRWLYVADLGNDKIWIYDLTDLQAAPQHSSTQTGYGPRHLVCHPSLPLVYLFCELSAMIVVFSRDAKTGALTWVSEMKTLPENFQGEPAGAAIHFHPSHRTLYVSNRNSNTLTAFGLDRHGELRRLKHFSSGGDCPRDFTFDRSGQWLVVANQESNSLSVFEVCSETGEPTMTEATSTFTCGSPVSLLFY